MLRQGTLLDLVGRCGPDEGALAARTEHIELGRGAWLELCPGFLLGPGELFDELEHVVAWRSEERSMYERIVAVPRLTRFYGADETLPSPALETTRDALNAHYEPQGCDPFTTAGLCLYRDGRDSVAWHGDRIGRGTREDVRVAIISLGATRTLSLRPRGGGHARRYPLGPGDLLVMGGSCQRTFEHAVPKTARPVGPRISVQFRPYGVR